MKTENKAFIFETGHMARQQRPVTARERTTSSCRTLDKTPSVDQRPATSLRRHTTCSACVQDRYGRWRETDAGRNHVTSHRTALGHRCAVADRCRHLPRTEAARPRADSHPTSKYVPYTSAAFRSLHSDGAESAETTSSRPEVDGAPEMSCAELPPIGRRAGSAKSRRSSRDSSSGGQPPKGGVLRYERPPLLTADGSALIEGVVVANGRSATKRAHVSAESNGSSSPSQHSNAVATSGSHRDQLGRAKSWCVTDPDVDPSPRLETLFERNGMISGGDRKSNAKTKPPRARMRSQGALTTSSMTVGMRSLSNSVSNLSKMSDANTGRSTSRGVPAVLNASQRRKPSTLQNAHKFKSEQNLASLGAATVGKPEVRSSSLAGAPKANRGKNANGKRATKNGSLPYTRSQPHLNSAPCEQQEETLTAQNLKNVDNFLLDDDTDTDSDTERNQRIHDWLIGTEEAEHPDIDNIVPEEQPTQTDTAIHIVYDKD